MEREQAHVAAMNERAYRRFVRQSLLQRLELLRRVRAPSGPLPCPLLPLGPS